jgi:DNA-binding phage protein
MLDRLQTTTRQGKEMSKKPLGRSIGEITQARVKRDPEFARALLQEAVQALLSDDVPTARSLIRDVIKGSIGYATLSRRTGTPEKSLVRMFGTNGNPTAANLFAVLTHLQHHSGVTFQVEVVRAPVRRNPRVAAERPAL